LYGLVLTNRRIKLPGAASYSLGQYCYQVLRNSSAAQIAANIAKLPELLHK